MYELAMALLKAGRQVYITLGDATELFLEYGDSFDQSGGQGYYIGSGNTCAFEWSEVTGVWEDK